MKKIGVFSDIHGNIQALQCLLDYFHAQQCEEIIHTGDVVNIGGNSAQCLQLLQQHGVTCVLGNHDRDFLLNNATRRSMSFVTAEHKRQTFDSAQQFRSFVQTFPLSVVRTLGGKKVVFQHYFFNNGSGGYLFLPLEHNQTAQNFDAMYSGEECDAMFFGHKHQPCDAIGKRLYVNVGSACCHPQPVATGIVLSFDEDFSYQRFAVPYDMSSAKKAILQMPDGERIFQHYYLDV